MNLKEAINWLETRPRFKDKVSLKKMFDLSERLGNPQHAFKSIHITGTNGKGSTAHFLSNILRENYRVGLFTSPYILKFNERLQINNEMISDQKLLTLITRMKEFIIPYEKEIDDKFTFFELLTMISFIYFKEEKVDYAIIEVGIGGKLDSTNIITPILAIITSLGKDHQKQLGNSLKSILINKLGIVKKNVPLITAVNNYHHLIAEVVKNNNTSVTYLTNNDFKLKSSLPLKFSFKGMTFEPKMQGLYQLTNAGLAVTAALKIAPNLSSSTIVKGINNSYNPGRFEIVRKEPYLILDGAHNIEAMKVLTKTVRKLFKKAKVTVLFACMEDKPFKDMVRIIKRMANKIVLTEIAYHRSLKTIDQKVNYPKYQDPRLAFNTLVNNLKADEVLIITGSLYFVSFIKNEFF
ncbi:MAG: bifunctional folylpolyglutamate synthase/dihydrofolate synthase [Acholeplasmataceae bacterium]|jgi:dihydrofolate synthase/folylpolyglutamate synthase|nr:bifunctional folylpolyglutamate synthase/dihydrofolate synthase [Acholeplasmataceae bacterium]HHT39359.1 bifunctional folylpolyglutamate synthase/dihydrofolate synthase [Acholeplasmataceae bacterium]